MGATDKMPLESLYAIWDAFSDVPVDSQDRLAADFQTPHQRFSAGIHREEVWRWFEHMNEAFVVGDVMAGRRVSEPVDDAFIVSIHFEKWTEEDCEAGEPGERGTLLDHESVDVDDLKRYGRDYGLSEACGVGTPGLYFASTSPDENREHFEEGIDTYYSLHVHSVNGHEPDAADYQRIAGLVGVTLHDPAAPGM